MFKCLIAAVAFYGVDAADFLSHAEPVAGSYIIVFKKGVNAAARESHMSLYSAKNVNIDRKYSIGEDFNGYSARMDQATLTAMLNVDEIDYIEEDGVVRTNAVTEDKACVRQEAATWGLVRSSEVSLKITGEYVYSDDFDGSGVTSYIIDTGVYIQHNEFEGRATWGYNAVDRDDTDGNGHGTHCAGTVGGKTYGMAKKANIVGVKVLSASGSGSTAGVIDGIDWVAKNFKKPSTGNMSLGGGKSAAMNAAVNAASNAGVIMVVAAGNDNRDACSYSPASAGGNIISVAASDTRDYRATFSNYGTCTDVFAPGVGITSAWINSPTSINTISGTSMASPHVCGQATKYMTKNTQATAAVVKAFITSEATAGLITNPGTSSPNLLLFSDCNTMQSAFSPENVTKLSKRY
jgi:subtilisin family serine protease